MRILPVNLFNQPKVNIEKNPYSPWNRLFVPAQTRDSFTGTPQMSGTEFKKLSRYMVDFYTAEPLLPGKQLSKMKKRGFFRGPISEVVKKLRSYKTKYLEPVELEVYECIEKAAEETPELTLPQLFNKWYEPTRSKFRKIQKPGFDAIKTLGAELPAEYQQKFFKFMETVERKLYDEPILQEFSQKEFSYKIRKATENISDTNFKNRIEKLLVLLEDKNFSNPHKSLFPQLVKKVYDFKNMKIPFRKTAYYEKNLKCRENDKNTVRKEIVQKIMNAAGSKGYKKIERLCQQSIDMLDGIPVRIPFSNKGFAYDLNKLLRDLPDSRMKQDMLSISRNLPTSSESTDALILKLKDSDCNTIGDRLFNPSIATIEHLKPQSEGGPSVITNYALAKKRLNSARGSIPLWQYLLNFPVKNQYKYADSLVKLNHRKKINCQDALGQLETIEREGRINLDIYKTRLKPYEEPIETFKKNFKKPKH